MKINKELFKHDDYTSCIYDLGGKKAVSFDADIYFQSFLQNLYIQFEDESVLRIRTRYNDENMKGFITDLNLKDLNKCIGSELKHIHIARSNPIVPYLTIWLLFTREDKYDELISFNFNYDYNDAFIDGLYEESDFIIEWVKELP